MSGTNAIIILLVILIGEVAIGNYAQFSIYDAMKETKEIMGDEQ